MMPTKKDLLTTFARAKETNSPYVFVRINAEGVAELIVIPERSFKAKEKFYRGAYNNDLTHVMNKNVVITNFSCGEIDKVSNII